MRCALAFTLTALVASSAYAEPSSDAVISGTRDLVAEHARDSRRGRIFGAITALTLGAAALPFGYHLVTTAESGGLVDLSKLQRDLGYLTLASGGLLLVSGVVLAVRRTPQERIHVDLELAIVRGESATGIARARDDIADTARAARRERVIVRGVGTGLVAVGAGSMLVVAARHRTLDDATAVALGVGGAGLFIVGGAFIVNSMMRTPIEKLEDALLPQPTTSLGIVPARGGVILGLGRQW